MDNRSTDQLDVELKDEDWIEVDKDPIDQFRDMKLSADNEKTDTEKLTKKVVIVEEKNPFRFPVAKTEEKSTSTASLETQNKALHQKRTLKFWDKWLKFFVLIGAGISIAILCLVLVEEKTRRVKK